MSNLDRHKKDLDRLVKHGDRLQASLYRDQLLAEAPDTLTSKERSLLDTLKKDLDLENVSFGSEYQQWYSEALEVISQILPNRVGDFVELYKYTRRKAIDAETYALSDFVIGIGVSVEGRPAFDRLAVATSKFHQQTLILESA
jgi:hypothetical protein